MNKIISILTTYIPDYDATHDVSEWTKTTIDKIIKCNNRELGLSVRACIKCGKFYASYNTCNAKNCPTCGFKQTYEWLEKAADVFPVMPYQHIVFTLPMFIRLFFKTNFKLMAQIQFNAASHAIKKFAKTRNIETFWLGVIQYCGELLNQHPHLHFIVPCGGLTLNNQTYKEFCYYHAKTLSHNYTKYFIKHLKQAYKSGKLILPAELSHLNNYDLFNAFIEGNITTIKQLQEQNTPSENGDFIKSICPQVGNPQYRSWCVYVGDVRKVGAPFGYIVRYLHHPPITQAKIISFNRRIVIKAKHPVSGLPTIFKFSIEVFLERFLDQFLPKGFHAVRRGGLLAPSNKDKMERLKELANSHNVKENNMFPYANDISLQMRNYTVTLPQKVCECGGSICYLANLCHDHPVLIALAEYNININDLCYSELKEIVPFFDSS